MHCWFRQQLRRSCSIKQTNKQYFIQQLTTIKSQKESTAILIFSRYAKEEASYKSYANLAGKRIGIELASVVIKHTQKQAEKSTLPVIRFFTDKQTGHTFGERLANAIEKGFALGFNKLIVTGTDTPCVNSKQFAEVAHKLNATPLVLAPTKDGGVYLIGITNHAFIRESFIKVPWLTNEVFNSLKQYASTYHVSLATETVGEDFDNVSDILLCKKEYNCNWFTLFISQFICSHKPINYQPYKVGFYFNHNIYASPLRGPPAYLF